MWGHSMETKAFEDSLFCDRSLMMVYDQFQESMKLCISKFTIISDDGFHFQ